MFSVKNKLALVTGSNRGLGLALASGLYKAGARVVVHGRDEEKTLAAAKELGSDLHLSFDVKDAIIAQEALEAFMAKHGCIDILVNNAGMQKRYPVQDFPAQEWDDLIATNLSSAFYVSKVVAAAMIKRNAGGKIIMIGSVQSRLARQTIAPYSASKGGIAMLAQGMTADLARFNIQVNTLSPGYFATDMNEALWKDKDFDAWLRARTPAARWGKVEELVGTLLYLSSSASDFVSGQNILVDGGMSAVV